MIGPHSVIPVGNGVGEAYLLEEAFHIGIERSAANNDFVKITAENIHCFLAHIGFYLIVDDGHAQQQLTYFVVDKRQDVFLDNLLHNKRHAGDDTRFDFRE